MLPYPHKALWPNGRAHWAVKAREVKKHRHWACMAARADYIRPGSKYRITITCCPKARGPAPDADNIAAAGKAYIDGIADALGVNDRHFAAPVVRISESRTGKFIIAVEGE